MANEDALESRPPNLDDLVRLCHELNQRQTRYIVVGGMAMNQLGFVRATEDIDLLVDTKGDNLTQLKEALLSLPDRAAEALEPQDLNEYVVIRIADEIVIDIMKEACGVNYEDAKDQIVNIAFKGVEIPFANEQLMWRLKQTMRAKDELDREFLKRKLNH